MTAVDSTGFRSAFAWLAEWLPTPFFHTPPFLLFFAVVFAVYWTMPRRCVGGRNLILVLASFLFYAAWSAELAFLVATTATIDYLLARGMAATDRRRIRLALLVAGIGMNLGLLAYFKYANFFLDSLNLAMRQLGMGSSFALLKIIVPFGISFYTFEAVSYAVDVYQRKIPAERSLPNFLLFILFFPHLVSGPIVRGGDFLPQVRRVKRWNWLRVQLGVQLFLIGAFKKIALADRFAVFSEPIGSNPAELSTTATWLGVIAFAFQIYFDFSGYTDMALGTAHLLGFRLSPNFNMPYLAANVSEFWRRWHISLSRWLRDYVFIPLGGSRGTAWQTDRNLMVTMLLGGLWHGAAWGFIVWGLLHGTFLIVHRHFRMWADERPRVKAVLESPPGTAGRIALTFCCVMFAWIFFRADMQGAWIILTHMVTVHVGLPAAMPNKALILLLVLTALGHAALTTRAWQTIWPRLPAEVQGLAYAGCWLLAMLLAPDHSPAFKYFDF